VGTVKGQDIQLDRVTMRYPGSSRAAVSDIDVHIQAGEFFSFLGPSGCGKTTLLRLISGFLDPTEGEVRIGGQVMRGIGPNRRPTAMIFQNLALFPLMSVAENIGFGLEVRGVSRAERRKRASALLELVDLTGVEDKRVGDLSGGQMQRVAIARGLAVEPAVLLLDEPLSALDLKLRHHMRNELRKIQKLRHHMRNELRKIQKRTGLTFVYITHDQGEALTMSDRVGVLSDHGRLLQVASAEVLYNEPESAFVANFVGENNAITGAIDVQRTDYSTASTEWGRLRGLNPKGLPVGEKIVAFVRPEAMTLHNGARSAAENRIRCTVKNRRFEGAFVTIYLEKDQQVFVMRFHNDGVHAPPEVGSTLEVGFSAANTRFLPFNGFSDA
jgi:spermidine/putrescine transport system ATP-binding protein